MPANRISDIAREQRDVTADTALRLPKYFDTTPEFWMNLQTPHDLSVAERTTATYLAAHDENEAAKAIIGKKLRHAFVGKYKVEFDPR